MAAGILVLGLGASACANRTDTTANAEDAPRYVDSHPADPPLSARIELEAVTVRSGGTIDGQVVVLNNTGQAIEVIGCNGIFQVALVNAEVEPLVGWRDCRQEIAIPAGESTYPVSVSAHHSCSGSSMDSAVVRCQQDGSPPPLPPGDYEARLYQISEVVPEPQPVAVRVGD
jgi:hypothetical protein